MSPSLRQFMIISIVGMSLLLASLLYFHLNLSDEYMQDHLSTHNRHLAIVLRNSLLSDGLEAALKDRPDSLGDAVKRQIEQRLKEELRWVPVVKVKIYSPGAMVLFSTNGDEIDRDASRNQGVRQALAGIPVSDLVQRNQVNALDGSVAMLDLHQQYIPIKDSTTGEILGVFEIYADVSNILAKGGARQKLVFWSIAGILGVFYLVLAIVFLRTHRSLQSEKQRREAHLAELTEIRNGLEDRVAQRTAELDKSKTFLQSVIDGIGNPLLVIRPDLTISLMNKATRNLIPKGADPSDYSRCYQISHRRNTPCDGDDHPCSFAQVMQYGRAARVRHTHYDENDQPMIVDLLSTPLYGPDGEFEGVIEVQHDVTQLVRMQAGLVESEARLQAIMDNVPDAILTCDADCIIQSVNSSALRLFSGRDADLVGEDLMKFVADRNGVELRKPDATLQEEVTLTRVDGGEFPADIWIGPIDLGGDSSYIAVIRDITARRAAQDELEKTRQQYFHQEKMAAIGQLAAGILHEVGNPIAAIAGAASELKNANLSGGEPEQECADDDAVCRNVELIDRQTARLGKITREIADFASPRPRERELLDLNSLLRSTARLLSYDRRFRDVQLDLELDKDLPAIVGVADQLTQVFMNLLINAMDACTCGQAGQARIVLSSTCEGGGARVTVRDNGCGMSADTRSRVMEPFFTTKPVGKGTGLGLSLCDTIALAHGGLLTIESEEGVGTAVHLVLPSRMASDEMPVKEVFH